MPCAVVSLDAMDASGQHQLEVMHDVFKQRLDSAGEPIEDGESKHEGRGTLRTHEQLLAAKQAAIAQGRPHAPHDGAGGAAHAGPGPNGECGNCFGAGAEGACCNSCEDVREAYRRKGWQFNPKGVEQCEREGFAGDVTNQLEGREGCVSGAGGRKAVCGREDLPARSVILAFCAITTTRPRHYPPHPL
jgi:endoplasmic reticulum-Golgi intermediate compartment protein 3